MVERHAWYGWKLVAEFAQDYYVHSDSGAKYEAAMVAAKRVMELWEKHESGK